MSESSEKRFEATPQRRERAKREGNVPRSGELSACAAFAAGLAALAALVPAFGALAAGAVRDATQVAADAPFAACAALVAVAFVPAACGSIAAVAVMLAQSGGLHVNAPSFDPRKLAPAAGLKRMFGGEGIVAAARSIVAFAVVVAAVAPVGFDALALAASAPVPLATAALARNAILRAGVSAAGVGAVFALADLVLARRRWLKSLRMSLEELKRDHKEQDGDPQTKSRRRHLHRALARNAIARTREASFVVANPTHVAVAVCYAPPLVAVPVILVRALDAQALAVRALAEAEGIPVVENVALARWLYRCGEAGRAIPAETFVAVAHVIAALIRCGLLAA